MKTEFVEYHPDQLPLEAISYLESALHHTPDNDLTIEDILSQAINGEGSIIVIKNSEIVGCTYIQLFPDVMSIVLLAGKDISEWKQDAQDFYIDLMKKNNIKNLIVVGRKGWGNIFKVLKTKGTLYSMEI